MAKELLESIRKDIEQGEKDIADAKDILNRLKKAGERDAQLERKLQEAEQRLKRLKEAFGKD